MIVKKSQLKGLAGISPNTLAKLNKDELVSMTVLIKLCDVLNCNIGDIVDVVRED
ncbi:helix-turn-helix domain-containing protein [Eubacterium aggregans]|uniref:helix-turn-helix domain-containing protein n=1 Tax=Eubacterium aggregans TaxID=81409 RepID=UPI003F40CF1E